MWIKNSNEKPDAILTFLTLTMAAVLGRYFLGGVTLPLPFTEAVLSVPVFESTPAVVLLGLLLPTYIARRHGVMGPPGVASALPAGDES